MVKDNKERREGKKKKNQSKIPENYRALALETLQKSTATVIAGCAVITFIDLLAGVVHAKEIVLTRDAVRTSLAFLGKRLRLLNTQ